MPPQRWRHARRCREACRSALPDRHVHAASAPRRISREVRPATLPLARVSPPSTTWRWKMSRPSTRSRLSGAGTGARSAISIAGMISLIAAKVAPGVASRPRSFRHAHGDLRLHHRLAVALQRDRAAGDEQGALHQIADQRRDESELLHRPRCAHADFPSDRLFACGHARAARLKLRGHALLDQRVVEIA